MTLLGALPLLGSSATSALLIRHEAWLSTLELWQWIPLYFVSIFTMALALTPTTYVAIATGFFLGWMGLPYVVIGYLSASIVGYIIGRFLDKGKFSQSLLSHPKAQAFVHGMHQREIPLIILSRLSPILPFALMNLLLSMVQPKLRNYIWGGFLGMLPRTMLSVWLGLQSREITEIIKNPSQDPLAKLGFILLMGLSTIGIYIYFKKVMSEKLSSEK